MSSLFCLSSTEKSNLILYLILADVDPLRSCGTLLSYSSERTSHGWLKLCIGL